MRRQGILDGGTGDRKYPLAEEKTCAKKGQWRSGWVRRGQGIKDRLGKKRIDGRRGGQTSSGDDGRGVTVFRSNGAF